MNKKYKYGISVLALIAFTLFAVVVMPKFVIVEVGDEVVADDAVILGKSGKIVDSPLSRVSRAVEFFDYKRDKCLVVITLRNSNDRYPNMATTAVRVDTGCSRIKSQF